MFTVIKGTAMIKQVEHVITGTPDCDTLLNTI